MTCALCSPRFNRCLHLRFPLIVFRMDLFCLHAVYHQKSTAASVKLDSCLHLDAGELGRRKHERQPARWSGHGKCEAGLQSSA